MVEDFILLGFVLKRFPSKANPNMKNNVGVCILMTLVFYKTNAGLFT